MNSTLFVSLHNKEPYERALRELSQDGVGLIGTTGTANWCEQQGIPCRSIVDWLDFEPKLDGQVKTLHPQIYQELLGQEPDGLEGGLQGVLVDLTPVNRNGRFDRKSVDIGGVSLLRATAKNYPERVPMATPTMAEEYSDNRPLTDEQRRDFAIRTLERVVAYDLGWRRELDSESEFGPNLGTVRTRELRYGENPDQAAYVARRFGEGTEQSLEIIGEKELSYTNCLDLESARWFTCKRDSATAVVIKHTNPTGWASGKNLAETMNKAWQGDPKSAFGGVVGLNRELTVPVLETLEDKFVEWLVVPGCEASARDWLDENDGPAVAIWGYDWDGQAPAEFRTWERDFLVQQRLLPGKIESEDWETVAGKSPAGELLRTLEEAWLVTAGATSNSAVVARPGQVLGVGAGQQSRVDAVRLACEKAVEHHGELSGEVVLASDGFFPFADNVEVAGEYGVDAIVQPGGSVRDEEVVEAARELGMTMVMTGKRVFRH